MDHEPHHGERNNNHHDAGQAPHSRSHAHSNPNSNSHPNNPVQSEEAIRARNSFLREQQRNLYVGARTAGSADGRNAQSGGLLNSSSGVTVLANQREDDVLHRPNLEISVNGVSCTLAQ